MPVLPVNVKHNRDNELKLCPMVGPRGSYPYLDQ